MWLNYIIIMSLYNKKFEFNNNKNQLLKSIIFAFLVLFSATLMPFQNSIISARPIEGDGDYGENIDTSMYQKNINDLNWQIKSNLYYEGLTNCFKNTNFSSREVPASQVINGHWFGRGLATSGPYLATEPADTTNKMQVSCDAITADAMKIWDIDPIDLLCHIGIKRKGMSESLSKEDCAKERNAGFLDEGRDKRQNADDFAYYIRRTIYGYATPSISNPAAYIYYRHSLNQSCLASANIDNNAPTNYDSDVDKDNLWVYPGVSWVGDDGTISDKTAYLNGSLYRGFIIPIDLPNLDPGVALTCEKMVELMNNRAEAFAGWRRSNPSTIIDLENTSDNDSIHEDKTSCAIEGIGWIVCPVVNFLASIVDGSWNILEGFLETKSDIVSNDSVTYKVWQVVRNLANVVFVIVFLIIIFSQVTSFGISNYGIKKLLPKLIISAVLVNVSFYICQLAVDVSNILGVSLKETISSLLDTTRLATPEHDLNRLTTGDGFAGIAGSILAAGIAVAAMSLTALIPVLLASLVALVMILFLLVGRQALIVLLVILSPLAFVAFLLPNTEKLFEKWKKTFMALLLLYPIVALVMGASDLASLVLTEVSIDSDGGWLTSIMAAAVAILPLFVVPGMLKKSLDGVGNIGGMINKLGDKAGNKATGKWSNSKLNKHMEAEKANKLARIQGGVYEGKKYNPNVLRSKLHNKYNQAGLSGKYGDKMSALGVSQADKFNDENVALATSRLDSLSLSQNEIEDIALGKNEKYKGNVAMRQAAIKDMVKTNNVKGINELWDSTISMGDSQNEKYIRNTFANSLLSSSSRPAYLGGGAIGAMRIHDQSVNGQKSHTDTIKSAIDSNTYSAAKIASADKDELKVVESVLSNSAEYTYGGSKHSEARRIIENARQAVNNPEIYNLNKNLDITKKIANNINLDSMDVRQISIDKIPKNNNIDNSNESNPKQITIDEL